MAYYQSAPVAAYPASSQKYSILEHYPRRQSQAASHALSPAQFIPGQALTRDQMQYVKSYNRAVAIYNASPRKNLLACSQKGCTNVLNSFGNLVIELHLHEIASNGTCCPVCSNWFESWSAKDRHMCPGPGGHCPEEDPDAAPMMPPVAQMSAADPWFFHQSMQRQQYAVVAARRAMETKRSVRPGAPLPCDFHGCQAHLPSEAALMEHIFGHFQHACGGLCASCKGWLPDSKSRDAHKCGH
ncbi:hypothetical protein M408DRAFT_326196 [Serendipita vermifera MAFF 305830]|uniref:C2H2-type domain-containing protein n=1 Tax=Serendipita vermifera MAFF 305830 TaxID=933852 RepID=A0A0C2XXA4_SERVB|nr:hypothetical protein M408DRAFT_326196 [Serendipita vermifera MAFF 305830]